MITDDTVISGMLLALLALIFYSEGLPRFATFYRVVPSVLLCYFLPSLLSTFNIIDVSHSQIYYFASRYLLPSSLFLLLINIDFKELRALGAKSLLMFLAATVGVMLGAPLTLLIIKAIFPSLLSPDLWRGFTTIAGSWIGGAANQMSMKEIFSVGDDLFSAMVTVDVIVANLWLAFLLFLVGRKEKVDAFLKADTQVIDDLCRKMEEREALQRKMPDFPRYMILIGMAFGVSSLSAFLGGRGASFFSEHYPSTKQYSLTSSFFWLVMLVTVFTVLFSQIFPKLRDFSISYGGTQIGRIFIYVLVAAIGTHMDIKQIYLHFNYFLIGFIWICIHGAFLFLVARWIRAPLFMASVGSIANIGGTASSPIMASVFHTSLIPVAIALAILGYAIGTICAYVTGLMMMGI